MAKSILSVRRIPLSRAAAVPLALLGAVVLVAALLVGRVGASEPAWAHSAGPAIQAPPEAPVLAEILNPLGQGDYLVSWSAVTGTITYTLQQARASGFISPTVRYSGPDLQFQVTGQAPGVWYYRVRATGAEGDGPWSNIRSTGVYPEAPVLYPIDNPSGGEDYLVDWSDVVGALLYAVEEAVDPEFLTPTVRFVWPESELQVTRRPLGVWYYRVRASNDAGASPWSETQAVTVTQVVHRLWVPLAPKLFFRDPYEPNDSFAQAWGPLNSGRTYHGYFPFKSDYNDYYYLERTTDGSIDVLLTTIPVGNDYALYLYDTAQNLIGYSDNYGNLDEHISVPQAPPQRYYVRVERVEGTSRRQPYSLTATFP